MKKQYSNFSEFYPDYLLEHRKPGTKLFHFVGTFCFLASAGLSLILGSGLFVFLGIIVAYSFAWLSHFFLEQNRPATFRHPIYSLMGDFRMFYEILLGKQRIR